MMYGKVLRKVADHKSLLHIQIKLVISNHHEILHHCCCSFCSSHSRVTSTRCQGTCVQMNNHKIHFTLSIMTHYKLYFHCVRSQDPQPTSVRQ
jgi:hypothetical protein